MLLFRRLYSKKIYKWNSEKWLYLRFKCLNFFPKLYFFFWIVNTDEQLDYWHYIPHSIQFSWTIGDGNIYWTIMNNLDVFIVFYMHTRVAHIKIECQKWYTCSLEREQTMTEKGWHTAFSLLICFRFMTLIHTTCLKNRTVCACLKFSHV